MPRHISPRFILNLRKHTALTAEKRLLVETVLSTFATRREARSFLAKYLPLARGAEWKSRANAISSLITPPYTPPAASFPPLRILVFKLSSLNAYPALDLSYICATIVQLARLGVLPVVVVDVPPNIAFSVAERALMERADKIVNGITAADPELLAISVRTLFETKQGVSSVSSLAPLLAPLSRGVIPIVWPVAYDPSTLLQVVMDLNSALLQLCSRLSESNKTHTLKQDDVWTVERLVLVDPLGGIPSVERFNSAHVYINLAQEYDDILLELHIGFLPPAERDHHVSNLKAVKQVCDATGAVGVITHPQAFAPGAVGINPIVHNVLTDRPIVLLLLPIGNRVPRLRTLVLRKGYHVEFVSSDSGLDLVEADRQGAILLAKLKLLIEDSFGRTLDLDHYLARINGHVAGVVIAGDYEGAAIVTYETLASGNRVAYLDKFAVARRSQGSSGVADVVFKAMVQAFPGELVWRSRSNNPVNKWYFERASGSFVSAKNNHWRVFWVGRESSGTRIGDYEEACLRVEPSWVDV